MKKRKKQVSIQHPPPQPVPIMDLLKRYQKPAEAEPEVEEPTGQDMISLSEIDQELDELLG